MHFPVNLSFALNTYPKACRFVSAELRKVCHWKTVLGKSCFAAVALFFCSAAMAQPAKRLSDDDLLTAVQKSTFEYFWDGAEKNSKWARERFHIDTPYVFYVGGWETRKNLPFLIDAFEAADLPGVALVLAGGRDDERERFRRHDRVRLLGWVDEDDLRALYAEAVAFVYPSRHEGFGLQVCEAMAMGCPVFAARATSLPEVLGDGGETFTLDGVGELAALLKRVTSDPAFRDDLVAKALRRSAEFSWRKAAAETAAVYRRFRRRAK